MINLKCECKNCKCINKKVAAIILVVGLFVGGGIVFSINNRNIEGVGSVQIISAEEAGEKVLNTINEYMLSQQGITASLVEVITERGLHRMTLDIGGQEEIVYVTKDGALLFPQMAAVDLEVLVANVKAQQEQITQGQEAQIPQEQKPQQDFTQEELRRLAKRLTDEGVIFFGTGWCPFCVQQKEMFGKAVMYLPYVECSPEHGATEQELALCRENNVGTVPDWRFPNKEPILGKLSIERLIELSGCQLLKDRIQ